MTTCWQWLTLVSGLDHNNELITPRVITTKHQASSSPAKRPKKKERKKRRGRKGKRGKERKVKKKRKGERNKKEGEGETRKKKRHGEGDRRKGRTRKWKGGREGRRGRKKKRGKNKMGERKQKGEKRDRKGGKRETDRSADDPPRRIRITHFTTKCKQPNFQRLQIPDHRSSQISAPGGAHTSSVDTHVPMLNRRRQWSGPPFSMTMARFFLQGVGLAEHLSQLRNLSLIFPSRTHSLVVSKDRGPSPLPDEPATCLLEEPARREDQNQPE